MSVNWKAMQVAGALKSKIAPRPGDVKPRYLVGGSYHADLHKDGQRRPKNRQSQ